MAYCFTKETVSSAAAAAAAAAASARSPALTSETPPTAADAMAVSLAAATASSLACIRAGGSPASPSREASGGVPSSAALMRPLAQQCPAGLTAWLTEWTILQLTF